jgi:hypothetical protein
LFSEGADINTDIKVDATSLGGGSLDPITDMGLDRIGKGVYVGALDRQDTK